jgi:hypothetical protein
MNWNRCMPLAWCVAFRQGTYPRAIDVPPNPASEAAALKLLVVLASTAATPLHATEAWFLMARHGECASVGSLKRKIPDLGNFSDPHAFAALMRKNGHKVTLTPYPVPKGAAYEVIVPEKELSLVFVTREICGASGTR